MCERDSLPEGRLTAYIAVGVVVLTTVCAQLWNEFLLKTSAVPMNLQNIWMYTSAMIFLVPCTCVELWTNFFTKDDVYLLPSMDGRQWFFLVCMILSYGSFGVLTAIFLKYLGSVARVGWQAFVTLLMVPSQILLGEKGLNSFCTVEIIGILTLANGVFCFYGDSQLQAQQTQMAPSASLKAASMSTLQSSSEDKDNTKEQGMELPTQSRHES